MNWKSMILRIKRNGKLSDNEIANKVGVTQPHISRLKRGVSKDPLWTLGEKLIKLDKSLRKEPGKIS